MKRKFTLSRDGNLRTTFRVEVRLSEEEVLSLREAYRDHFEDNELPSIHEVLQHLIQRGEEEFWAAAHKATPLFDSDGNYQASEDEATDQRESALKRESG